MKILMCNKCNKKQSSGKYCLDCGQPLKEVVNTEVQFKPIVTSRSAGKLKADIRRWLERLGVQQSDITISGDAYTGEASVSYVLNQNLYEFSSSLQLNVTNNLATVEQFLHYRVLGIERGIETTEQAFKGYEALPDYTDKSGVVNPYEALGFKEPVDIDVARKKYKELVKRYHPDVNPNKDTQVEFQRIKKAMEELELFRRGF